MVETLKEIEIEKAPRKKQGDEFVIAPMIEKEMAKIDWKEKSVKEIKNLVRGLNPIMGAYSTLNSKKIKFWRVDTLSQDEFVSQYEEFKEYKYKLSDIEPGTVIYVDKKEAIYIIAKDGIIKVLEIQGENAKKMPVSEFLKGNKIEVIDKFE